MIKKAIFSSYLAVFLGVSFLTVAPTVGAEYLDSIVAVVEDDVILDSELRNEVAIVRQKILASDMMMPPDNILYKQVLERLIIAKLQRLLAERSGIRITDEMLNASLIDIASQNGMNLEQFRAELENQGMDYQEFTENVRNEIIINQLRGREIGERIKVTDREVEHFMETQGKAGGDNIQYHLGHILVSVPEGASASEIQQSRKKAEQIVSELRAGQDFQQKAVNVSDGGQALKGGDLGWRSKAQMPTIFVDEVETMQQGTVSDPIRSPSGYHIIKMLEIKGAGAGKHMVTQTKVRHILIKTNELVDDDEAKRQLTVLKERIVDGDDFANLARAHSDDPGSALKGGDLGWVAPGALVAPFETSMDELQIGEIGEPVQTQFGWHLIQVLDRQQRDNSEEFKKNLARDEIRKRKIEEETELWLRRLRDEAYVDIRIRGL